MGNQERLGLCLWSFHSLRTGTSPFLATVNHRRNGACSSLSRLYIPCKNRWFLMCPWFIWCFFVAVSVSGSSETSPIASIFWEMGDRQGFGTWKTWWIDGFFMSNSSSLSEILLPPFRQSECLRWSRENMDIQDIQVFESEKKLVFFLRFLSFFSWKMETGERTSTPFFGPKKAIVIGNQMINYWMFHHFPIIFPSFSSIFPWIFSWIFPSRDHTPGLEQGRSHGGLLRLQLP